MSSRYHRLLQMHHTIPQEFIWSCKREDKFRHDEVIEVTIFLSFIHIVIMVSHREQFLRLLHCFRVSVKDEALVLTAHLKNEGGFHFKDFMVIIFGPSTLTLLRNFLSNPDIFHSEASPERKNFNETHLTTKGDLMRFSFWRLFRIFKDNSARWYVGRSRGVYG